MATQKMQTTPAVTITLAGHMENGKETTMNKATTMSGRSFGWIGWASASVAAVALAGAVSLGLVNGFPRQEAAVVVAPAARVIAAAPNVSDRFRALKLEQAEQRAGSGMVDTSRTPRAIPHQYVALKARQLARHLDAGALVVASTPAAWPSARERFAALKDSQAAQRADAAVATHEAGAPAISLVYRTLKNQRMEARLTQPEATVRRSMPSRVRVHEGYRTLKERQAMARADRATVVAPSSISERYRELKDLELQRHLEMER